MPEKGVLDGHKQAVRAAGGRVLQQKYVDKEGKYE
jgi:hypothetical protein